MGLSARRPELLPWNKKFAQELKEQAGFSAAFRKSPMKRAKITGLQRNARTVIEASEARRFDSEERDRCAEHA